MIWSVLRIVINSDRQRNGQMAVSDEMESDRVEWRKGTCCTDPKRTGKRAGRRRQTRRVKLSSSNGNEVN
jgi:hypothetical protein